VVTARKYVLAQLCIFCVASGLIKISILLFYRRISSRVVSRTFRLVTWIAIGFIAGYTIALTIAPIVGCQPISAFWDQVDVRKRLQGYKYHCFDEGADIFAASVLSAVQDLATAVLPTFLFWNLRIPLRQKIALFGIFAIGYGCVALSGLRAYYSWRTFYETYDVTWSTWDLLLTSLLELHVGCFCANAPALKVFFKHFFHDKLASYSNSRTPKDSSGQKNSGNSGSNSSKGIFGKVASLMGTSHSQSGYISEPHNSVSVDAHGGVLVQKEIQIQHSQSTASRPSARHHSTNTTDLIYDQYYNEDIELGRFTTGHNSQASSARTTRIIEDPNVCALPPMPKSPGVTLDSFKTMLRQASMGKDAPRTLPAAAIKEEKEVRESTRTPTPVPALPGTLSEGGTRPEWQSWR
jgi:hypothetical protein